MIINVINFRAVGFMYKIYQKRCTRLATASDKVYQLLARGRWFFPASSTTKTGRHDIAESDVKTPKIKSNQFNLPMHPLRQFGHQGPDFINLVSSLVQL